MEKKIEKSYLYEGLDFPVHLTNVPFIKVRGEFILDIDFNKLQKAVLLHLCYKKTPLTGNEVKFIRKYFSFTTTAFANQFGHTHSAILKWENHGNKIAKITPSTEIYLRIKVLEFLEKNADDFFELYKEITIPMLAECLHQDLKYKPILINAKDELTSAA